MGTDPKRLPTEDEVAEAAAPALAEIVRQHRANEARRAAEANRPDREDVA